MADSDSFLLIFPPMPLALKHAVRGHFPKEIFREVAVDLVMCYLEQHGTFDRFMAEVDLIAWNFYEVLTPGEQTKIDYIWKNEKWCVTTLSLLQRFYHEYSDELLAIFHKRSFELVDFVDDFSANGLTARVRVL